MLLIIHLEELNIWILLSNLTDLQKKKKRVKKWIKIRSFFNWIKIISFSSSLKRKIQTKGKLVLLYFWKNWVIFMYTFGWSALQPPQPGEKKSRMTNWLSECNKESTRSWADWISFMLGCSPFSHHFIDFPIVRPTCNSMKRHIYWETHD